MALKRLLPSAVLAVGVTCGIGLFMARMIATEFMPQEKVETLGFEINPEVEDIAGPDIRDIPEPYKKVETPPPPPVLAHGKTEKVVVAPVPIEGKPIEIDAPILIASTTIFIPADINAQPLVRIPPIMPPKASRSGHCKVRFDVSPQGQPLNIETIHCSQKIFARATIKSVQNWKFNPRMQDGLPVTMRGVKNNVRFNLTDERGNLIPE